MGNITEEFKDYWERVGEEYSCSSSDNVYFDNKDGYISTPRGEGVMYGSSRQEKFINFFKDEKGEGRYCIEYYGCNSRYECNLDQLIQEIQEYFRILEGDPMGAGTRFIKCVD